MEMFDQEVSKAIAKEAKRLKVEEAALKAIVYVESGGRAFAQVNAKPMPLIRWEGHYFYRHLPAGLRSEGIRKGLSARSKTAWGEIKNPKSQQARYNLLERAKAIHEEAAYSSCSWGIGQVMGAHWEWLGYKLARDLAERAMSGIEGQLELMIRFIEKRGLLDEMRERDFRGFARVYNGSGQVDHYAKLMRSAYKRYSGSKAPGEDGGSLRVGSKGSEVRALQQNLRQLGYYLHVDGDFGPATKATVIRFQNDNGLTADGIAGPKTLARIDGLLGVDELG